MYIVQNLTTSQHSEPTEHTISGNSASQPFEAIVSLLSSELYMRGFPVKASTIKNALISPHMIYSSDYGRWLVMLEV